MTGCGFTFFTAVSAPHYPVYNFVGIIFCLFFGYTLIRQTFVWAALSGNAIVAIYILTASLVSGEASKELYSSFFYMMGINLLGMGVSYSQEVISRKEFVLNELLRHRQEKISDLNSRLEERVEERTDQLSKSLSSLEQAEAIAGLGYFEQNWQTGKIFWSKGFARILGAPAKEQNRPLESFLALVDPEDADRLKDEVIRALANGEKIDAEFKMTTAEKDRAIQIHVVADSTYDDAARPVITRGIIQDVTDRKRLKPPSRK